MKTKLLFVLALFFSFLLNAQTNNWFQYAKPNIIYAIVPDDTNANILHLATDIGYIQLNTLTDSVSDFFNLTSQNPPIGKVTSISLNPTNNHIALGLTRSFAIYDGNNITIYDYANSDLTVGENSNQFTYLQVEYAKDGSLYIFIEDAFGYQKFNNGIVDPEVVTSFKPQAIVENNTGTKAYFAGSNNGLWELDKATSNLINHTTSNSDLSSNFINALLVDDSDNLFIGHYQGLDRLESNGTITTCNATSPIPVFDIDINPANGELLVRNSKPNSPSRYGFSLVDYDSCSWINYTNDGSNCLDDDAYLSCTFGGNGDIYCNKGDAGDAGDIYRFDPITNSCSQPDINYLGATEMFRSSGFSEVNVRNSSDPFTFEIAITNTNGVDVLDFPEEDFDGTFSTPSNFSSFSGPPFDIINAGSYYVFTDASNTFTFMDENGTTGSYTLPISDFSLNKTKKADVVVSGSTCTLVFSGWQGQNFETKLYMTECDMANGSCSAPVEICSNNRDTSGPITFSCTEDDVSSNFRCAALKNNDLGEIALTEEIVSPTNGTTEVVFDHDVNGLINYIQTDPIFLDYYGNDHGEIFIKDENGTIVAKVDKLTGGYEFFDDEGGQIEEVSTEFDGSGSVDPSAFFQALYARVIDAGVVGDPNLLRKKFSEHILKIEGNNGNRNTNESLPSDEIPESVFEGLPSDIFIYSIKTYPYSNTDYATILMTNYGILIKSSIDYSFASLGIKDEVNKNSFILYPNPANDLVSFSNKTISKLEVFDINGRRVLQKTGSSFSVNTLAKGIYVVKGRTSNNITISKKLIVN